MEIELLEGRESDATGWDRIITRSRAGVSPCELWIAHRSYRYMAHVFGYWYCFIISTFQNILNRVVKLKLLKKSWVRNYSVLNDSSRCSSRKKPFVVGEPVKYCEFHMTFCTSIVIVTSTSFWKLWPLSSYQIRVFHTFPQIETYGILGPENFKIFYKVFPGRRYLQL